MATPDFIPADPDFIPAGTPAAQPQQPTGEGTFLHPYRSSTGEVLLTSYPTAIRHGLESVGSGISGAVSGLVHPIQSAKSVIALPGQAMQVPAAIRDINQSPDPAGTYAKAAEETAGQGAGQALTAAATPYALKAIGKALPAGIRLAARSAEAAANQKLIPLRPILNINSPADAAEAVKFKIPGRDFGLRPQVIAPEATSASRTMPGQVAPEVTIARPATGAAPIPPRSGLLLPEQTPSTVATAVDNPSRTIGSVGKEVIYPQRPVVAPIPPRQGLALPPAKFDARAVENAARDAADVPRFEPKPNVPLREQMPATAGKEGHLGQFARANGTELDTALSASDKAKVHALSNVQVRQLAINMGEDMGQQGIGRGKLSGNVPRPEVFARLLKNHSPQEIVRAIDAKQYLPPENK